MTLDGGNPLQNTSSKCCPQAVLPRAGWAGLKGTWGLLGLVLARRVGTQGHPRLPGIGPTQSWWAGTRGFWGLVLPREEGGGLFSAGAVGMKRKRKGLQLRMCWPPWGLPLLTGTRPEVRNCSDSSVQPGASSTVRRRNAQGPIIPSVPGVSSVPCHTSPRTPCHCLSGVPGLDF